MCFLWKSESVKVHSQNVVPRWAASLSWNLSEVQILVLHPRSPELENLRVRPWNLCFTNLSRWFWSILTFENLCAKKYCCWIKYRRKGDYKKMGGFCTHIVSQGSFSVLSSWKKQKLKNNQELHSAGHSQRNGLCLMSKDWWINDLLYDLS